MVSPTAVVSLISTTVRADNGLGVTGLVDGGKILMVCGIPIDGGHDNWDNHTSVHLSPGSDKLGVTKMVYLRAMATTLATILMLGLSVCVAADSPKGKPNILLIVADDMGYSDLGCFGGEIRTPHLDALAKRGIRATNFCVAPTCSPTRAMLLTGTDNHIAGLGCDSQVARAHAEGNARLRGSPERPCDDLCRLAKRPSRVHYVHGWEVASGGGSESIASVEGVSPRPHDDRWRGKPLGGHEDLESETTQGELLSERKDSIPSAGLLFIEELHGLRDSVPRRSPHPRKAVLCLRGVPGAHRPLAAPDAWIDKYRGAYDQGYDVLGTDA